MFGRKLTTLVIVEAIIVVHLVACCTSILLLTNSIYYYFRALQIALVVDEQLESVYYPTPTHWPSVSILRASLLP